MMKKTLGFVSVFLLMVVAMAVSAFAQPTLPLIGDKAANEGQFLQFTGTLTAAPDLGNSVFAICNEGSATGTCISGAASIVLAGTTANITNLSDTQFQFNWTPDFTASGTYYINFSVKDSNSSDSRTVKITVADVPPSFTVTGLALGGKSQERSNPKADDEKNWNVNVTGIVTITNTGGETIKNLKLDKITGLSKYSSSFANANSHGVTLAATELAPGASTTATVILRVPETLDAVDNNLKPVAFDVAQLTFSGTKSDGVTALSPVTSTVNMMAENNLKLSSGTLKFDGKSEKVSDGDTVDKIKPGMAIDLELEAESRFKDRDSIDLEDITLNVESTGDTEDLDVDENEEVNTLGPADTDAVTISFTVEEDAKKGKEPIVITLDGVDENGARYGERWEINLEIQREDHEIEIKSATLSPSTVTCEQSSGLSVQVRNTGRRDEEKVFLRVYSTELSNFNSNIEIGALDADDEKTTALTIPVAASIVPGTYRVNVETYYNVGTKSGTDAAILTKKACETVQPTEDKKENVVVVTLPPQTNNGTSPALTPGEGEAKGSFLDSTAFMALLILGYVVVLGGGALVLIRLLRK